MTAMHTQQELDDRYGRARSAGRRRWTWILGGAVVLALIGYFGWNTYTQAAQSVDIDVTGFDLSDAPHSVTVDFQLTLARGSAVSCVVEAQDEEHGIVGWKVVSYPADDAHSRTFSERVATTAAATTGLVPSCWIP